MYAEKKCNGHKTKADNNKTFRSIEMPKNKIVLFQFTNLFYCLICLVTKKRTICYKIPRKYLI